MTRKPIDITDFIEDEPEPPRKPNPVEARKPKAKSFPDQTRRERTDEARKKRRSAFFWWAIVIIVLSILIGD